MALTLCAHCGLRPTVAAVCSVCDAWLDHQVAQMENLLERRRTRRHYEALAAEAVEDVSTRLGRSDDAGQRLSQPAAPVVVSAGGGAP